jgi:hypothetical protein
MSTGINRGIRHHMSENLMGSELLTVKSSSKESKVSNKASTTLTKGSKRAKTNSKGVKSLPAMMRAKIVEQREKIQSLESLLEAKNNVLDALRNRLNSQANIINDLNKKFKKSEIRRDALEFALVTAHQHQLKSNRIDQLEKELAQYVQKDEIKRDNLRLATSAD